jgi:hypothetical protein
MIWAPMSEIPQIGRNPVYISTLALFVILQIPTALATNFGMLLAFRFITGFVGSPSLATGGASIADMYRSRKRAYGIGIWGVAAVRFLSYPSTRRRLSLNTQLDMRSSFRSSDWGICRATQRLDMDDLGPHDDFRHVPRNPLLFPP